MLFSYFEYAIVRICTGGQEVRRASAKRVFMSSNLIRCFMNSNFECAVLAIRQAIDSPDTSNDVHRIFASRVLNKHFLDITDSERNLAKHLFMEILGKNPGLFEMWNVYIEESYTLYKSTGS